MKNIYSDHIAIRNPPKNIDDKDLPLFEHEFLKKIHGTTIVKIKNADILIDTIFYKYQMKFFTSFTHLFKLSIIQKIKRLLLFFKDYNKIHKGVWIIDNWSFGYFHWITDSITRLIASEKYLKDHVILLPNYYKENTIYIQSLQMLNFEVNFYDSTKRLKVNELLIPSHTAPTGNYNKELINKVRDRFLLNNEIVGNKRIFISRQKASRRKIVNEDDLFILLKSFEFEIHFFEDYDFLKQVNLMKTASHFVGLHGAGLTNMLFMNKNSKVLELRIKDDSHNNCYFSLASDLEHHYYYLLNESYSNAKDEVNVVVNLKDFKETLEKMLG
jgi:capsular polysaccharide biosynthesis protein